MTLDLQACVPGLGEVDLRTVQMKQHAPGEE
jgi:hypothetical protein